MGKEYIRESNVISDAGFPTIPIFVENFTDIKTLEDAPGQAGALVEISTEKSSSGPASLYLRTKTTTPTIGDFATVILKTPSVLANKLEMVASVAFGGFSDDTVRVELSTTTPEYSNFNPITGEGKQRYWGFRINFATRTVEIQTGATTWTQVADVGSMASKTWIRISVEVDLTTEKYVEMRIQRELVDISTHSIGTVAEEPDRIDAITVRCETRSATTNDAYIDYVLLKQEA